jgi:hypothetical protein
MSQHEADPPSQPATPRHEADAPTVKLPKADAQLGPDEPETRLAPAESPIPTSVGSIPVPSPALDPLPTAALKQNPASVEPLRNGGVATAEHAIDQGGAPIGANNPQPQPQPQLQRDQVAHRHTDKQPQGVIASMIENINDVLSGTSSSAPPRRAQVGSKSK